MTDHDPVAAAEDALDDGAQPPQVLRRFGMAAVREQRLGVLLDRLELWDPGFGAQAVGHWAADLVDAGYLVPRDDGD